MLLLCLIINIIAKGIVWQWLTFVISMLSEIYIQDFEEKIVYSILNAHDIIAWYRYVDDIIVIYNPSIRNEHIVFRKLNSYNKKLKFTIERENNRTLNFVDVKIILNGDKIITDVYRKPTANNT